ncbi:hypothetical protein QGN29_05780 [Temperatibacter marinus]|uniref:Uncharacterized protein n=1 Tax=Temperatibacter marinus TaxID=1456591 RepID=A0AA52EJD9_9PROT|nr:hypothetical protein [Temperatibacter marinus]WND03880.1 hypothetical protein QGN29_05780 [Temperatibacter marinus]
MKLIATSVVRGSFQGESHGGVYLLDLDQQQVTQPLDWNTADIDWQGRGWDRGLRGIAFHAGLVYIAASDELFAYTPDFQPVGSWRNPYLKHCHEISVHENTLFLTSTAYDSILGFDLIEKKFNWALHVDLEGLNYKGSIYDPYGDEGPLSLNKLHLNMVTATTGGLYISGRKSGGMLLFNGETIHMSAMLPPGTHNAQPFREGVLFNDSDSDVVRYASRSGDEDRALKVPLYPSSDLTHQDFDDSRTARQGFARGLCVINERLIAGGSSPSTICVHDLQEGKTALKVNLTMDIRNAVHGLEVWPY